MDYRALNRQTKKDVYPLPRIDDLLDKLAKAKYLSAIDLASGYHQIAMAPEDIEKTAFVTRYGLYEYTVLPLGLCNAPSTFQCLINKAMKGYIDDFVGVYLDDILVYTDGDAKIMKGIPRRCLITSGSTSCMLSLRNVTLARTG